jgi:hypothetical protein
MNITTIIGSTFEMSGWHWEVKTEGEYGWFGVQCIEPPHSFISMHIEEIKQYLNG